MIVLLVEEVETLWSVEMNWVLIEVKLDDSIQKQADIKKLIPVYTNTSVCFLFSCKC